MVEADVEQDLPRDFSPVRVVRAQQFRHELVSKVAAPLLKRFQLFYVQCGYLLVSRYTYVVPAARAHSPVTYTFLPTRVDWISMAVEQLVSKTLTN